MPKLVPYEQQVNVPGASNLPRADPEVFRRAASLRGLAEGIGQTADFLQQRLEQKELSQLNAEMSKATAELTIQLQEDLRSADPNDDQFAERFSQKVNDRVTALQERATTNAGRNYLTKSTAALQSQFLLSATQGQIELAGEAAKANYMQSLNLNTSALVQDPAMFEFVLQQQDFAVDSMVEAGTLSSQQAISLKAQSRAEAARAAVAGWTNISGETAKEMIEAGTYDAYVDGTMKAQLLGQAEQAIRAEEVDRERARAAAERAKREANDAQINAFLAQMVEKDPENPVTARSVLDAGLDPKDTEHMLRMIGYFSANSNDKTDPIVMSSALQRAYLPANDPNRLTEEEIKARAGVDFRSAEDVNQLLTAVQGGKTTEGRIRDMGFRQLQDLAYSIYRRDPAVPDPAAEAFVMDAMLIAQAAYDKGISEGKTPQQLLFSGSPDYIGRMFPQPKLQDQLKRYTSVLQGQQMQIPEGEFPIGNGPGSTPRNPVQFTTAEEAAKLPVGTWVRLPDGTVRQRK